MTSYQVQHVLDGTGGVLRGSLDSGLTSFTDLERDARKAQPGNIFIAIRGERFDGHDFVGDAFGNGASAAIVSAEWANAHPEIPQPLIVVDDPIPALQRWAAWWRNRLSATVVGITGSVGKTSAKEAVSGVLRTQFRTHHNAGNLNTEVGLPLSLLAAPEDAEAVVLEMGGAYAFGELRLLADIARPHIGVVTNVYPVHLERMGSIEAIAQTKTELVEALSENGTAVLNIDDFRVRAMAESTSARVLFYGFEDGADVHASNLQSHGLQGSTIDLTIQGQTTEVQIPQTGPAGVQSALTAFSVGHLLGVSANQMEAGLRDPAIVPRMSFVTGPRGSKLLDDTYNASKPSVIGALDVLKLVPGKRRVAVLGEMRELGTQSEPDHRAVGEHVAPIADVLVVYGDLAAPLVDAARTVRPDLEIHTFGVSEKQSVIDWLAEHLGEGDVALLKGSRGLEMEHMVSALKAEAK